MNLLTYIFPKTLVQTHSEYHGDIRVIDFQGTRRLLSNGITQTSRYHSKLFQDVFRKFVYNVSHVPYRVLVLGVGGGFVFHELGSRFPYAHQVGVDIDSTMLDIGKKWFGLSELRTLQLVSLDAFTYVKAQAARSGRFDIIIVDLFNGNDIPGFVWDDQFVTALSQVTSFPGLVIINFNHDETYKKPSMILEKTLQRHFENVQREDIKRNRFFIARKPKKH